MTLTAEQAYAAMFRFLEVFYRDTKSDDVGALLGSMSLLEDGCAADPAITSEWLAACKDVLSEKVDLRLKLTQEPNSPCGLSD